MTNEIPQGTRINSFTGEVEDAPPLSLNPDPITQRRLSDDPSKDRPLPELNAEYVASELSQEAPEDEPEVTKPAKTTKKGAK